jgi:hypothetical protein
VYASGASSVCVGWIGALQATINMWLCFFFVCVTVLGIFWMCALLWSSKAVAWVWGVIILIVYDTKCGWLHAWVDHLF